MYENAWRGRARLLPSRPVGTMPLSLRLGRSLALVRLRAIIDSKGESP